MIWFYLMRHLRALFRGLAYALIPPPKDWKVPELALHAPLDKKEHPFACACGYAGETGEEIKQHLSHWLRLDPDGLCPACGHCSGKLECASDPRVDAAPGAVVVLQVCHVCGAQAVFNPVLHDRRQSFVLPRNGNGNGAV